MCFRRFGNIYTEYSDLLNVLVTFLCLFPSFLSETLNAILFSFCHFISAATMSILGSWAWQVLKVFCSSPWVKYLRLWTWNTFFFVFMCVGYIVSELLCHTKCLGKVHCCYRTALSKYWIIFEICNLFLTTSCLKFLDIIHNIYW